MEEKKEVSDFEQFAQGQIQNTGQSNPPVVSRKPMPMWLKIYLLVIGVIVIACLGGYIFFAKNDLDLAKVTNLISPTPESNSAAAHPSISSSSAKPTSIAWKTYTSATYNFSLMYPSDWSTVEDVNKNVYFYPPEAELIAHTTQNTPGSGISPNISEKVLDKPFIKQNLIGTSSASVEIITTKDNLEGYLHIVQGAPFPQIYFDLPLNENQTLEFNLTSIGKKNIDAFNKEHHAKAKDADINTFREMLKTIYISKQ